MVYLGGIVIVLLLFLALHYFTELDKKSKLTIVVSFGAVVLFGIAYNYYNDTLRERIMNNEIRYNQGKILTCNSVKVDKKGFSYSVGTQTLIGRKNSPHAGVMIDISQCQ